MTRSSRPRNVFRRSLLVVTTVGALALASAPLANATPLPAPLATPMSVAAPGPSPPVFGGLIDSVIGIINGAIAGINGAARAVLCPLLPAPVCATVPPPRAQRSARLQGKHSTGARSVAMPGRAAR
ncbi:MAG: hypothetical protein QOI48_1812 [Solirubrobacteraceae bacterium]|jgi:hypothetical protein|nr:hypothetical protein [Solirubrobacteraceae bacterium]